MSISIWSSTNVPGYLQQVPGAHAIAYVVTKFNYLLNLSLFFIF
jgi:hypothetical protein